jgi:hypothetical protein
MNRRRLDALERLFPPAPTCQCLLAFCPQQGQTMPPLDVVCDRCGLRRDPETTLVIEEIIVETRRCGASQPPVPKLCLGTRKARGSLGG